MYNTEILKGLNVLTTLAEQGDDIVIVGRGSAGLLRNANTMPGVLTLQPTAFGDVRIKFSCLGVLGEFKCLASENLRVNLAGNSLEIYWVNRNCGKDQVAFKGTIYTRQLGSVQDPLTRAHTAAYPMLLAWTMLSVYIHHGFRVVRVCPLIGEIQVGGVTAVRRILQSDRGYQVDETFHTLPKGCICKAILHTSSGAEIHLHANGSTTVWRVYRDEDKESGLLSTVLSSKDSQRKFMNFVYETLTGCRAVAPEEIPPTKEAAVQPQETKPLKHCMITQAAARTLGAAGRCDFRVYCTDTAAGEALVQTLPDLGEELNLSGLNVIPLCLDAGASWFEDCRTTRDISYRLHATYDEIEACPTCSVVIHSEMTGIGEDAVIESTGYVCLPDGSTRKTYSKIKVVSNPTPEPGVSHIMNARPVSTEIEYVNMPVNRLVKCHPMYANAAFISRCIEEYIASVK